MMRRICLGVLGVLLAVPVWAAGTLSETVNDTRSVRKYTWTWVSSAAGAVSGTVSSEVSGEILRVVFLPDGGATQPTNLYDVTLLDEDGLDVLMGLGANLSNATDTHTVPFIGNGTVTDKPVAVDGVLTPTVANAGDAKGGVIIIYVR